MSLKVSIAAQYISSGGIGFHSLGAATANGPSHTSLVSLSGPPEGGEKMSLVLTAGVMII